jgi:pSer/pThr/pTyr-binding forkhead associated (FHA) protein
MIARLIPNPGSGGGRRIEISPGIVKIGKAPRPDPDATLVVLTDDFLSREHALIEADSKTVRLHDLGSTNGSFVNGERIESAVLRDGDEVRLGAAVFRVEIASQP